MKNLTAILLILFSTLAFAKEDPVYTGLFSNVAVGGYDPVAYFTEGKPVEGKKDFSMSYQGAEIRFASQANLELFQQNPEVYFPQYGGYCSWAVSQGYTAKGDPEFWRIVDGKLYLNYNQEVQQTWEADIPGFIGAANSNWPKVLE